MAFVELVFLLLFYQRHTHTCARAYTQLYIIPHLMHNTQSMFPFLLEMKRATRRHLEMGWLDGWMDGGEIDGWMRREREFLWEWRKHPLASPNNDGLESAFVYTSSRMNAIQKTINIRLKLNGTVLCCSAVTYHQVHLYRHVAQGSKLISSHVSI